MLKEVRFLEGRSRVCNLKTHGVVIQKKAFSFFFNINNGKRFPSASCFDIHISSTWPKCLCVPVDEKSNLVYLTDLTTVGRLRCMLLKNGF